MSDRQDLSQGTLDLLPFARRYFEGGRAKLIAVLVLDIVFMSITGVGLLLILPLLGLLGFGSGDVDNPIWLALTSTLDRLGLTVNLPVGLALFIAAVSARALLNWRRATWQVEVEQQFQTSLRTDLYKTLSRTELYRLQRLRTSEFIQSAQTESRRTQQAANVLFQLFSQAVNLCVYFTVALLLSWQITVFAILCGVTGFVLMLPLVRRTDELSRRLIRVRSSMVNNLIEHIQGLHTARSLGLMGKFVEQFGDRCRQSASYNVQLVRLSALSSLAFEIVAVVLLAAIVYAGLSYLEIEATRFVVLLIIFIKIFPSIGVLQSLFQRLISLVPSFRHYLDLLNDLRSHEEISLEDVKGSRILMEHSLELSNVSFSYRTSGRPALRDVSLTIEKGTLTAIGGHSGSGKSTLVDIATGLLPAQRGDLLVDGNVLGKRQRILWRREIGMVPQDSFLFDDTIRANLQCAKMDASEQELWDVLGAVKARAFVESREYGLDSGVGEGGRLLAGGERQRVCIARALLRNPQLLVLDEPTNNLDEESEVALLELLNDLKRDTTLIVVSHEKRILRRADRVFELEGGRLINGSGAEPGRGG
jgi:ATP-binding cassette subfamily C protein